MTYRSRVIMLEVSIILFLFSILPPYYLFISSKKLPNAEPDINNPNIPKLTILLPVRNEIKNIERKINEILLLFLDKDAKLIIIDSNSRDSTAINAKNILLKAKTNIQWKIISTELIGKSKAINSVIDSIDTPWFIMFDADASVSDSSLNYIFRWMQDPSCGAVCGSQKIVDSNSAYRKRFNLIRKAETFFDSATIFEGSICAVRLKALNGNKLVDCMNADDTQFALMVKRNGYRAIFESRAFFTDQEPLNLRYSLRRSIRRSQGLLRVLWLNRDLMSLNSRFGRYYANSLYFYVLFPWFFLISMIFLIHNSIPIMLMSNDILLPLSILSSIIILFKLSFILSFFNGLLSLIIAQISLFLGIKYNSWIPERK
jgi:cellulose synthase/poly-beta-1,6-N-acetylglucosamine synthase-like glycosyltransferase